jgi:hypothetical protein
MIRKLLPSAGHTRNEISMIILCLWACENAGGGFHFRYDMIVDSFVFL